MLITAGEIAAIMPRAKLYVPVYLEPLNDGMLEFAIDNPDRIAAFISQIAHESAELSRVEEGLNYSAERLAEVWPVRFPSIAFALPYSHNPQKLANYVYANRMGNGDAASGDGWQFRGSGLIQTTGREQHGKCASYFGIPLAEIGEWMRKPEGAARSACFFWRSKGLNQLADIGQFTMISRRINGGTVGLKERAAYWERAKAVLA